MNTVQVVTDAHEHIFKTKIEAITFAPGRVNLIGEHTDYNDGFVFPMALEMGVTVAISGNDKNQLDCLAVDFSDQVETVVSSELEGGVKLAESWIDYIRGVVYYLSKHAGRPLKGANMVIKGTVPIGAGLSSSACLELAVLRALCALNDIKWNPVEMAVLAQKAENKWVGVNCGIMDQLISAMGQKDHAVLIDCRSLECAPVRLPGDVVMVVMDTTTRRGLVESAYNERRAQCEEAAQIMGVDVLRDVTLSELSAAKDRMDELVYRRAHHVITENQRTLDAKMALEEANVELLGTLFNQSHASLAHDFEVTNEALDVIVSIANQHARCYGARMTGAGFGGCALAIVSKDAVGDFIQITRLQYAKQMGCEALFYSSTAEEGARILWQR